MVLSLEEIRKEIRKRASYAEQCCWLCVPVSQWQHAFPLRQKLPDDAEEEGVVGRREVRDPLRLCRRRRRGPDRVFLLNLQGFKKGMNKYDLLHLHDYLLFELRPILGGVLPRPGVLLEEVLHDRRKVRQRLRRPAENTINQR